jgi:hypothetical protein
MRHVKMTVGSGVGPPKSKMEKDDSWHKQMQYSTSRGWTRQKTKQKDKTQE